MNGQRAMWFLGLAVTALAILPLLVAGPSLPPIPPQEAFDEYVSYQNWRLVSVEWSRDAETAKLRLVHPDGGVVAVLHYRLISASMFEAPVERPR